MFKNFNVKRTQLKINFANKEDSLLLILLNTIFILFLLSPPEHLLFFRET